MLIICLYKIEIDKAQQTFLAANFIAKKRGIHLKNDILLLILCVHFWVIPYTFVRILSNDFRYEM
jgi:hypothetical protein